ncbi:hypothetical protein VTN96DRAFT_1004 [Rasamsonia emersonii]
MNRQFNSSHFGELGGMVLSPCRNEAWYLRQSQHGGDYPGQAVRIIPIEQSRWQQTRDRKGAWDSRRMDEQVERTNECLARARWSLRMDDYYCPDKRLAARDRLAGRTQGALHVVAATLQGQARKLWRRLVLQRQQPVSPRLRQTAHIQDPLSPPDAGLVLLQSWPDLQRPVRTQTPCCRSLCRALLPYPPYYADVHRK